MVVLGSEVSPLLVWVGAWTWRRFGLGDEGFVPPGCGGSCGSVGGALVRNFDPTRVPRPRAAKDTSTCPEGTRAFALETW